MTQTCDPRPTARFHFAVAATLLALALAACGGGDGGGGGDGDGASGKDTEEEAVVSAKDGTDYDACRDATCEVVVSGETDIEVDGDPKKVVSVTGISDAEVAVECAFGSEGAGGSVSAVVEAGKESVLGCQDLDVSISDVADGSAVLTFAPGDSPLG